MDILNWLGPFADALAIDDLCRLQIKGQSGYDFVGAICLLLLPLRLSALLCFLVTLSLDFLHGLAVDLDLQNAAEHHMERDAGLFQNDFLQSLRGALALQDASVTMGQVDGEGVPVLLRCAAAKKAVGGRNSDFQFLYGLGKQFHGICPFWGHRFCLWQILVTGRRCVGVIHHRDGVVVILRRDKRALLRRENGLLTLRVSHFHADMVELAILFQHVFKGDKIVLRNLLRCAQLNTQRAILHVHPHAEDFRVQQGLRKRGFRRIIKHFRKSFGF